MPWHLVDILTSITFGVLSFLGIFYSFSQSLIGKAGVLVGGAFIILCGFILIGCAYNLWHNYNCLRNDIKTHRAKSSKSRC